MERFRLVYAMEELSLTIWYSFRVLVVLLEYIGQYVSLLVCARLAGCCAELCESLKGINCGIIDPRVAYTRGFIWILQNNYRWSTFLETQA